MFLASSGMGMGGGIRDHFKIMLKPFYTPPMHHKYDFQPKTDFLEMTHTNFVSSIRIAP